MKELARQVNGFYRNSLLNIIFRALRIGRNSANALDIFVKIRNPSRSPTQKIERGGAETEQQ